jgi:hypothetical protein
MDQQKWNDRKGSDGVKKTVRDAETDSRDHAKEFPRHLQLKKLFFAVPSIQHHSSVFLCKLPRAFHYIFLYSFTSTRLCVRWKTSHSQWHPQLQLLQRAPARQQRISKESLALRDYWAQVGINAFEN